MVKLCIKPFKSFNLKHKIIVILVDPICYHIWHSNCYEKIKTIFGLTSLTVTENNLVWPPSFQLSLSSPKWFYNFSFFNICFYIQEKKKAAAPVKPPEVKRTRRDRGELEDIMFKLFERQPNWALKQLVLETDQPAVCIWVFFPLFLLQF